MFAAELFYRESGPADGPVALMLHGYPESSYMWEGVMPSVAAAGWRAIAPDFAGFGELDGVAEQVREHLPEAARVSDEAVADLRIELVDELQTLGLSLRCH